MKKLVVVLLTVCMIALGISAMAADKMMIKSSDVHGDGYPPVEAIKYMGELLNKWTNGRLTIQVYGSMQLGGEKEALEQVQVGALEMTRVSTESWGRLWTNSMPSTCRLFFAAPSTCMMSRTVKSEPNC